MKPVKKPTNPKGAEDPQEVIRLQNQALEKIRKGLKEKEDKDNGGPSIDSAPKNLVLLLLFMFALVQVHAGTKTWTNGNSTGIWSDGANWSPSGAPGSGDDVVFNSTSTANASIDANFSIKSLTIASTYSGRVSEGSSSLGISAGFAVSGASAFDPGSGKITITGNATLNSAAPVYDLEIAAGSGGQIAVSSNLTVNNSFTLTSTQYMWGGTKINVMGNVTINSSWLSNGSVETISLTGSSDQTLTGSGIMSFIDISKTGGSVLLPSTINLGNNGTLTGTSSALMKNTGGIVKVVGPVYTMTYSGTIDDLEIAAGGGGQIICNADVNVNNDFTLTSTAYMWGGKKINVTKDATINSSWLPNGSTVTVSLIGSTDQTLGGTGTMSYIDISKTGGNVLLPSTINLGNSGVLTGISSALLKNTGGIVKVVGPVYTMTYSGTIDDLEIAATSGGQIICNADVNVNNNFTLTSTGYMWGGKKINVTKNVIINSAWLPNGNTVAVSFVGSADQTLSGSGAISNIDISKLGGKVLLLNDMSLNNGIMTGTSSGIVSNSGGKLTIVGSYNFNYSGSVDDLIIGTNAAAPTVFLYAAFTVNNSLSLVNVAALYANSRTNLILLGDLTTTTGLYTSEGQCAISLQGMGDQNINGSGRIAFLDVSKISGNTNVVGSPSFGESDGHFSATFSGTGGNIKNAGGSLLVYGSVTCSFAGTMDDIIIGAVGGSAGNLAMRNNLTLNKTLTLNNVAALYGVSNGYKIILNGDLVTNTSAYTSEGNLPISMQGSTDQNISGTGYVAWLDVSKTSGHVLLQNDLQFHESDGHFSPQLTGTGGDIKNVNGKVVVASTTLSCNIAGTIDDFVIGIGSSTSGSVVLSNNLNIKNTLTLNDVGALYGNGNGHKVILNGDLITTTQPFTQEGNCPVSMEGSTDQNISGGGFLAYLDVTKPSGNVLLQNDLYFRETDGHFSPSLSGTSGNIVNVNGKIIVTSATLSSSITGSIDDLVLGTSGGASGSLVCYTGITINKTLTLNNVAAVYDQFSGYKLNLLGDLYTSTGAFTQTGNLPISLDGTGDQNISGAGYVSWLDVTKASGNVYLHDNLNFGETDGHYFPQITGNGTIINAGGKLVAPSGNFISNYSGSVDDLVLGGASAANMYLQSNDLVIAKSLTLANVGSFSLFTNGKKIILQGDLSTTTSSAYSAQFPISLQGAGDQTISGTGKVVALDISKTTGNVLFGSGFSNTFTTVTISSGRWDMQGDSVTATSGFSTLGGLISGIGTLAGNVTCTSGGISPAGINSVGCITIDGNLSMNSGATYTVDVANGTVCTDYDQLKVNGTVSLSSPTLVVGNAGSLSSAITIINNDNTDNVSGTFNNAPNNTNVTLNGTGYKASYNNGNNDVVMGPQCTAPSFTTCPSNQSANTASNACSAAVSYTSVVSGTPAPSVTYTLSGATTGTGSGDGSGATFNKGTTTVSLSAANACGTATCSFTVTVSDNVKPVVVTKNATVYLNGSGSASIATTDIDNGSSDNCGAITLSLDKTSFTGANLGANTVTLTAKDGSNNSASATATVTVLDTTHPVAKAKNITADLDTTGSVTITGAQLNNGSSDNSGTTILSLDKSTFNCNNLGANTVTLTVKDASGNASTSSATVTVKDTIAPGGGGALASLLGSAPSVATSNVPEAKNFGVLYQVNIPSSANYASTTVSYAVDNSGKKGLKFNRIAYLYQLDNNWVWVSMDTLTTNLTKLGIPNVNNNNVVWQQTVKNMNVYTNVSGVTTGTGITTGNVEMWTDCYATSDGLSGIGGDNNTYDYNDTRSGGNNCYGSFQVHNYGAKQTIFAWNRFTGGGANDVGIGNQSGGSGHPDWTFEQNAGSYTNRTLYILVGSSAGVATNDVTTYLDASGNASITVSQIDKNNKDNCSIASRSLDKTSFTCSDLGANTVTLTLTDESSNVSSGTATVTVKDTIKPKAFAQNFTANLDATGNVTVAATSIDNGSTDNCSIATRTLNKSSFNCSNLGNNNVVLTVADASGNAATANAVITIKDVTAPVAHVQNITVNLDATGHVTITPAQVDNGSTDNCAITSKTLDKISFDCTNIGANTVTLTLSDASGNTTTATATVTVKDVTAPTVNTQNINVTLDNTGNATITASQIDNVTTDNCSIANRTLDKTSFTCSNIGNNTVTLTVTDASGNSSSKTATVTVLSPTISLSGNGNSISNGGSATSTNGTDFGQTAGGTISKTYTITNNGTASLNVNSIVLSGTGASAFAISGISTPVALAVNGTATFTVTFNTVNPATYNATVTVNNNDCRNTAFAFGIQAQQTCIVPSISTQPSAVTVCSGTNATFTVSASGTSLAYQWQRSTDGGSTFTNISGANSSSYTETAPAATFDNDQYQVVVTGTCGTLTSNAVTLRVNGILSASVANETVCSGASATFSASVSTSGPASVAYQWYESGSAISGATSTSYTVTGTPSNDGHTFVPSITVGGCSAFTIPAGKMSYSIFSTHNGNGSTNQYPQYAGSASDMDAIYNTSNSNTVLKSTGTISPTIGLNWSAYTTLTSAGISIPNSGDYFAAEFIGTFVPKETGTYSFGIASDDASDLQINGVYVTSDYGGHGIPGAPGSTGSISLTAGNSYTFRARMHEYAGGEGLILVWKRPSQSTYSLQTGEINAQGTLSVNSVTAASVGNQTVCAGSNATFTVGSITSTGPASLSYQWQLSTDGGSTYSNITGAVSSSYTVASAPATANGNKYLCLVQSDACTAFASTAGTLTVNTTPSFTTCPANQTANTAANSCNAVVTYSSAATGSPSPVFTYTFSGATTGSGSGNGSGASFNKGTTTVTIKAANTCGSQTCSFTVTVSDNVAPVAKTKDISVNLDASGHASIATSNVDNGSTDNCGAVSLSLDKTSFDCSKVGANTVTLTVTDASNNVSTSTATVTVIDNIKPTVKTQDITVNLDANGAATISTTDIDNGSSDNCHFSLSLDKTSFDCANTGVNTVTLTATDASNNSTSANATVTVKDNTAPTAICKTDSIILDLSGNAYLHYNDINNGSYDNCGIASYTLSDSLFTTSNVGNNSVTLTVKDASGNTSSCTTNVYVIEPKPVARCKDATIYLDANGNASISGSDIDNGSSSLVGSVSLATSQSAFNCSNLGTNKVWLIVTNQYHKKDSCQANVTVKDAIAPTATAQNVTIYLDANGKASTTASAVNNGSTDNCTIASLALDKTDFNCSNLGNNTVTLTVTDQSSNASTATATVTVKDAIAPTAITQNVVIYLDATGKASTTATAVNNGSFDNCTVASIKLDKCKFDCSNLGANTVTLTVTDQSGNASTSSATVTVKDTIHPLVTSQNVIIYLDANGKASTTASAVNNGSTDNCTIASLALDKTNFDCSNLGDNTVTLTVTDQSGNASTSSATVTVKDAIAPTATAQNVTIYLDANGKASTTASAVNNGSTDNCTIASLALDKTNFTCSNVGDNTVTLTVTDQSGNASTATATVTVKDNIKPTVSTKNITVYLDVNGKASITPSSVDNGSYDNCSFSLGIDKNSFTCSNEGANTVTLTATDASGNASSATATVTVKDSTKPTVITKNVLVTLNSSNAASISANDINNGSYDNCTIVSVVASKTSFNCSNVGANTVTLTVTDNSGNVSTGTATVTVKDPTPPVARAKNITVYLDANGSYTVKGTDVDNGSSDNCSVVSYTISPATYGCSNLGVNKATLTVADAWGNTATATCYVTVKDNTAPTIKVKNVTVYIGSNGKATLSASQLDNGTSDNCAYVLAFDHDGDEWSNPNEDDLYKNYSCYDIGNHTVYVYAIDKSYNYSAASVTVTVADTMKPVLKLKDITVNLGTGSGCHSDGSDAVISTSMVNNGSYDNCSLTSMTLSKSTFTCSNTGVNTVTVTATDASGNTSTGTVHVTVKDITSPHANANDLTLYLDASGNASTTAKAVNNGSYDNCSIASMKLNDSTFTCADLGTSTIYLTVTDASGNTGVDESYITVKDNIKPTAIAKNVTVYLDATGKASVDISAINNGSYDNCSVEVAFDRDGHQHHGKLHQHYCNENESDDFTKNFDCSNIGNNTVTIYAIDPSGNYSTATATVTVLDNIAPVAKAKNITVYLGSGSGCHSDGSNAVITPSMVDNGSSDNCSVSLSLDKTTFDCSNLGANTVTLTAKDPSGNTSTTTATVTVKDNTAPHANAQDMTVTLDGSGNASITAAQVNSNSYDNCSIASMSLSKTSFTCANVGRNTVTLTVTDPSGNSSVDYATITVVDNTAPTAKTKNITVSLDANGQVSIVPSQIDNGSSDNCSVALTFGNTTRCSSDNKTMTFNCNDIGTIQVTLRATDPSGNYSTSNAMVTVVDNSAPVVITKNISVTLSSKGAATIKVSDIDKGSYDNCSIASESLDKTTFSCANVGANTVTLTVKDPSGNTSTGTAIVTVKSSLSVDAGSETTVYYGYSPMASASLSATASGGGGSYSYKWSTASTSSASTSSATSIAKTSSITVSPTATTVYYVTVTDANGCTATDSVQVDVIDVRCGTSNSGVSLCKSGSTSCVSSSDVPAYLKKGYKMGSCDHLSPVMDMTDQYGITLSAYPNPFTDNTTISFTVPDMNGTTVELYNLKGQKVQELFNGMTDKNNVYTIDLKSSQLQTGVYMVRLTTGSEMRYIKLIKLN